MKKISLIIAGIISILISVSCVTNPVKHNGNSAKYGSSRYYIKFYNQNKTFEIYEEYYRRISHKAKMKNPKLLFVRGFKGRRNIHGNYSINNNKITFKILYKTIKYSYYDNSGNYHFGKEIGLNDIKESYSSNPIVVECERIEFGDTLKIKFIKSNSKPTSLLLRNKKGKSLKLNNN